MTTGLLAGTAYVDIRPKLDNFGAKLSAEVGAITRSISQFTSADLEKSFKGLGASAAALGKSLTMGISVPLIGAGVIVSKFAIDFNREMANVGTLIPGNTARVRELKSAVQDMAIGLGTSTSDLSGGLYQVISAFGDTADTVAILETNAMAAKAGLASTTEAIGLTSAVTKAYGDTSADAVEHVADLALMTVRLGQTTFPELAGSIGTVTPLAASLGVTVEDLFGTMSTFTGVTGSASEVSTQLRGVLQALLAPTESMSGLFDRLGVTSGEALIAQQGLAGAVQTIVDEAEQSGRPLQDFVSSIEGQTLALAGAGGQADAWVDKIGQMGDTAGTLDEAFREMTEGINESGFSLEQAQAAAQVAAQRLGDALAPAVGIVLRDIVPLAVNVAELAAALLTTEGPLGTAARGLAAVAVAAGPTVWVFGKMASGIGSVIGAFKSTRDALSLFRLGLGGASQAGDGFAAGLGRMMRNLGPAGVAGALGAAAVAVGVFVYAHQQAQEQERKHRQRIVELTDAIREQEGEVGELTRAWLETKFTESGDEFSTNLLRVLNDMGIGIEDLEQVLASGGDELDRFTDRVKAHADEIDVAVNPLGALDAALQQLSGEWQTAADAAQEADQFFGDAAQQAGDAAGPTDKYGYALRDVADEAGGARDEIEQFQTALDQLFGLQLDVEQGAIRWRDSLADLADTIDENGNTLDINTEKGRANREALIGSTRAALDYADAIVRQTGDSQAATFVLAGHADQLVATATQAGLSEDAAIQYAASLLGIPPDVASEITNTADLAAFVVDGYQQKLDEIPIEKPTRITVDASQAYEALGHVNGMLIEIDQNSHIVIGASGALQSTGLSSGGLVPLDVPVLVGEEGTEIMRRRTDGQVEVLSAPQTRHFLADYGATPPASPAVSASRPVRSTNVTVGAIYAWDAREAAKRLREEIAWHELTSGRV